MILTALLLAIALPIPAQQSSAGQTAYETAFREAFRSSAIKSCVSAAKNPTTANLDMAPTCTCLADQLLATKTVQELSGKMPEEELRSVTMACIKTNPPQAQR